MLKFKKECHYEDNITTVLIYTYEVLMLMCRVCSQLGREFTTIFGLKNRAKFETSHRLVVDWMVSNPVP